MSSDVSYLGREEVPDVLPAQADHRRAVVVIGRHAGNLANVRNTLR